MNLATPDADFLLDPNGNAWRRSHHVHWVDCDCSALVMSHPADDRKVGEFARRLAVSKHSLIRFAADLKLLGEAVNTSA